MNKRSTMTKNKFLHPRMLRKIDSTISLLCYSRGEGGSFWSFYTKKNSKQMDNRQNLGLFFSRLSPQFHGHCMHFSIRMTENRVHKVIT